MGASILAGRDRMDLDNGMRLRLLSALEVLQARREAEELTQSERERALCSNACLLSRALETQEGEPVFSSGREVLAGLRVEEIAALAATWSRFNREENPGLAMEAEQAEDVKKTSPGRGGAAAVEGAENLRRPAHRGAVQGHAGPGLCLVPDPHGPGSGGGALPVVPQLPPPGGGGAVPGVRPPGRELGGGAQPLL